MVMDMNGTDTMLISGPALLEIHSSIFHIHFKTLKGSPIGDPYFINLDAIRWANRFRLPPLPELTKIAMVISFSG